MLTGIITCSTIVAFTVCFIIIDYYFSAPYGRYFSKKFNIKLERIARAQRLCDSSQITVVVQDQNFNIVVKDDIVPKGLRYETFPAYTSKSVLINDELVCRAHSISHNFKDHIFLEFSNKRESSEVIKILNTASKKADSLIMKSYLPDEESKSFF